MCIEMCTHERENDEIKSRNREKWEKEYKFANIAWMVSFTWPDKVEHSLEWTQEKRTYNHALEIRKCVCVCVCLNKQSPKFS